MNKKIIIIISCVVALAAAVAIASNVFSYECYDCGAKVIFQKYARPDGPDSVVKICSTCFDAYYNHNEDVTPDEPDITDTENTDSPIGEGEPGFDTIYYEDLIASAQLLYPSSNDEWEYTVYQDTLGIYSKFVELTNCLIDQSSGNTIELLEIPSEIEGYPVIALGNDAMLNFDVYELVIPNTVIHIGKSFCFGCDSLEVLTLPSSLITIEDDAFYGHRLSELKLPEKIEYIGDRAFAGWRNYKISEVILPESLAYIGYSGVAANEVTVLNPNMVFGGASDGGLYADIFYGYEGSTTATFCSQERRTFKLIP